MSTPIHITHLTKKFGKTVAVDDISVEIPAGSLFFLLGPSGCGKTTLLRMIAGFADPTAGTIAFGDREVTHLAANKRNCGMVFQSYALWPHMTVHQNVGFGLDVRKVSVAEKKKRVDESLEMVQMTPYASRKPNELSGGQQQRVALARALVIEPTVLLLDEPLSNLDAKLRLEMRQQIRNICKKANITGIYVTHDQKEALSMADHIAVLQSGKVMQVGAPRELYDRPANRFVADFLGETNFLAAEIAGRSNGQITLSHPQGQITSTVFSDALPAAGNVTCSIRPEAVRVRGHGDNSDQPNVFDAELVNMVYLGEMAQYQLRLADGVRVNAFELNPRDIPEIGSHVEVHFDPADVVVLQD